MTIHNPSTMSPSAVESALVQLYARYIDATWRIDTTAFGECFTDDATWEIVGRTFVGRDVIETAIADFLSANQRVLIKTGPPLIFLDNDTISAKVMINELIKTRSGEGRTTVGTYIDVLKFESDRLLFQKHSLELHYSSSPDRLSAPP